MALTRPLALLAALVLLLAAPAGAGDLPFEVVSTTTLSPRLVEVTFATPAADGGTAAVRILLPDGFDPSGATRYPVLYLLHGGGGGEADWTDQGDAEAATAGLPLIVVMPGVTGHGNYVDWYNHGRGGAPMWETYLVDQLLPWVDATYPTVAARHGRAVAGLSMGGGGAMGYAAHHPDLFVAAAAFSGAVDTNTVPVQLLAGTAGVEHGHEPGAVNGHRLTDEVRWRGDNPWDLAANLHAVDVVLATGNGEPGPGGEPYFDPVEQQCWEMTTNLHQRLVELGIDHHFDDYGPGAHSWWYWSRDLVQYLPHLLAVFAEERPAPAVIDFTTPEPSFAVHGWQVDVDRPAMEFASLEDADAGGFTLRGTGSALVTTPATYEPGSSWSVSGTTVTAGDDGRLRVEVDLGPGNPFQQYTVAGNAWALAQPGGAWPVRAATVTISAAGSGPAESQLTGAPVPRAAGATAAASTLPATGAGPPWSAIALLVLAAAAVRRVNST